MDEDKQDRRTLRTQEMLIRALLELIEKTHYDQITVKDIVEQANVGRSTFYAHYQNKDELLIGGFEHMLNMLVQHIDFSAGEQLTIDTSMLFKHAQGHFEIYRTLIWGSGFELLIQDGHAVLSQKIEDRLKILIPSDENIQVPLSILAYIVAGALLVLLKWWLDNKLPYAPEQMDEFFQLIMMPGIRSALD